MPDDAPRPATPADEAAMLPVRSAKLTPGTVARRVIEAPGLRRCSWSSATTSASRAWLRQRRAAAARARRGGPGGQRRDHARRAWRAARLAPGLPLAPASGDDLAQRLGLRHYPVLITATGIEQ
jgi:integrating conjugative element protein (TIGR03765 family)